MRKHPVRKFLGLMVLYAVLIFGIFILQFKTESVISRNIGALRISLAQTEKEDNKTELRNQLQVSFRGIAFTANDTSPAIVSASGRTGSEKNLVLSSWSQPTDLSALFTFTDGSTILFAVSDKSSDAQLSISVQPSTGYDTLTLAYKPAGGYSVKEQLANRILIASKSNNFALNAPHIGTDRIKFNANQLVATYTSYDPTRHFAFESIISLPLADEKTYEATVKQVRDNIITRFTQAVAAGDTLSEQDVIAYVAEMASTGRYDEALDAVPDSFKKGNKRTYLSSPYFDNLSNMNKSLVMQTNKYDSMVSSSIDAQNLDIFTVDGIADYVLREKRTARIRTLLSMPAAMDKFEPTVTQAAGIIALYTRLAEHNMPLAALFDRVLEQCTETIATACTVENQNITLTSGDTPLSVEQTVQTGAALIAYGSVKGLMEYSAAGYLMVNSAISSTSSLELHTLSAVYPMLASDNTFYPHTIILGYYGAEPVWAWTCANNITYVKEASGTIDVTIDFPLNETHYVIFNGVPTFHANIEIQQMKFRTDPRFETYNSSGYVYQTETETLFIKSRHKSQKELIRLFCDPESTFVTVAASAAQTEQHTATTTGTSAATSSSTETTASPARPAATTTAPATHAATSTPATATTHAAATSAASSASSTSPANTEEEDTTATGAAAATTTNAETTTQKKPAVHGPNSDSIPATTSSETEE
jgi:hypothetical protein